MSAKLSLSIFVLYIVSRKKVKPLLVEEAHELPTRGSSFYVCGCVELEALSPDVPGCTLLFSTINHINSRCNFFEISSSTRLRYLGNHLTYKLPPKPPLDLNQWSSLLLSSTLSCIPLVL